MLAVSIAGWLKASHKPHLPVHTGSLTKTAFSDPYLPSMNIRRQRKTHIKPHRANMNQESSIHTIKCKFTGFETDFIIGLLHNQQATSVLAVAYLLASVH